MTPFLLREDQVKTWLTELIVARELHDAFDGAAPSAHAPPIGMAWHHGAVGEEDPAVLLVKAAQQAGLLAGPPGAELRLEYLDDGGEGYYRFLLDVPHPAPLTLASPPQGVQDLADPGASAPDAALMILRCAAAAGQRLLDQLVHALTSGLPPNDTGDRPRP